MINPLSLFITYLQKTPKEPPFNIWSSSEEEITSKLTEIAEIEFLSSIPRSIDNHDAFKFEIKSRVSVVDDDKINYLYERWKKLFDKITIRILDDHMKDRIAERDKFQCSYCTKLLDSKYDIHHVLPTSKGGTDSEYNLVLSCEPCNKKISSQIVLPLNWWQLHPDSHYSIV